MAEIVEKISTLEEILVKKTYQVVIHKERSFDRMPIAFGAGSFLNYKAHLFFPTADHNIHIEDHDRVNAVLFLQAGI